MDTSVLTVEAYKLPDGTCPFKEWRRSIKDIKARVAIDDRVDRAALRNFGDCKPVGNGVHELRLDIGPGYRIYFATEGQKILLLLTGSDKSHQKVEIVTAQRYLVEYRERSQKAVSHKEKTPK